MITAEKIRTIDPTITAEQAIGLVSFLEKEAREEAMTDGEWHRETGECPYCHSTNAVFGKRLVTWCMHVPSFMGDSDDGYESASAWESYFQCPDCGESDADPATY